MATNKQHMTTMCMYDVDPAEVIREKERALDAGVSKTHPPTTDDAKLEKESYR
jgi:hypothetical protein